MLFVNARVPSAWPGWRCVSFGGAHAQLDPQARGLSDLCDTRRRACTPEVRRLVVTAAFRRSRRRASTSCIFGKASSQDRMLCPQSPLSAFLCVALVEPG